MLRRAQLFLLAWIAVASPIWARDFIVTGTIPVGSFPESAVLTPNGKELYVGNRNSGTVSVIDTATRTVSQTISVGASPHAMVVRHDGRSVYLLVDEALVVIRTSDRSMRSYPLRGRSHDLALTPDDSSLYVSRVYEGVYAIDTETMHGTIVADATCPIGLAMSPDGRRLWVSYQCIGPSDGEGRHGSSGHDGIGLYELPSFELIAVVAGPPNVGGQILVSPNGRQLWVNGNDACSRPDAYDQEGCPFVPGRVVNVFDTASLKLMKTFTFSLDEGNGAMSFSPAGEAFVGGGLNLKIVSPDDLGRVQRKDIAGAGNVVFLADGKTAFVAMADRNAVAVLAEWSDPNQTEDRSVAPLSLCSVLAMLRDGDCAVMLDSIDDARIVSLIQDRNIEFHLTPEIEAKLAKVDKSGVVVDAVVNRYLMSLTQSRRP